MGSVISCRPHLAMNRIGCRPLGNTFCVSTMFNVMARTPLGLIIRPMKIPVPSPPVLG